MRSASLASLAFVIACSASSNQAPTSPSDASSETAIDAGPVVDAGPTGPSVPDAPDCPPTVPTSPAVVTRDGGAPIVLASNQNAPRTVAVDGENLYWVNVGSLGGVYKMPKAGGAPVPLYEGPIGGVESLGLDSTYVYFPIEQENRIVAVPIAGGSPKTLATSGPTSSVAIANGNVYWLEPSADLLAPPVAKKVPTTGGAVTPLTAPSTGRATRSYFMASTSDAVYASLIGGGGILRFPLDGGSAVRVGFGEARGLAADSAHVYFAASDIIDAIPTAGGCPVHLAGLPFPVGVAADDAFVYFTDTSPSGRILKVSKSGDVITVLADHQGAPHGIAVDEGYVYWSAIDEGAIKKIAK